MRPATLRAPWGKQVARGLNCSPPALRPAGWTLTSISGFSQAFARAVDSTVAIRSTSAAGSSAGGTAGGAAALAHRPPPAHLGHGLSQGVASLAEGVAAGITGVVRAPIQVRAAQWQCVA